ncbi:MAG TPA: hypothetical protein VNT60_11445 [Deinococcales bacterium]|nr:hypothetical protein [Deinococcales bacterium]
MTRVFLNGGEWVVIGDYPRPLAESLRRALAEERIPSVVRTPFQWVLQTPVIEIEAGAYQGAVALLVSAAHEAKALAVAERVGLTPEALAAPDSGEQEDGGPA